MTTALHAPALSCVLDEQSAHRFPGGMEEVPSLSPVGICIAEETQIRLVDKRRGLERVVRTLVTELRFRHRAELGVDQGNQPVHGLFMGQSAQVGKIARQFAGTVGH